VVVSQRRDIQTRTTPWMCTCPDAHAFTSVNATSECIDAWERRTQKTLPVLQEDLVDVTRGREYPASSAMNLEKTLKREPSTSVRALPRGLDKTLMHLYPCNGVEMYGRQARAHTEVLSTRSILTDVFS
jgi:hypothetical protein